MNTFRLAEDASIDQRKDGETKMANTLLLIGRWLPEVHGRTNAVP